MKKISLLALLAFATISLTACSSGPKADPASALNPESAIAQPSAEPVAKTVAEPAPTPTQALAKPRVAPPSAPKLVTLQNFEFQPRSLTINKGETVKWVNKDGVIHTVTSDSFQSGVMEQNHFFTNTFTTAGTFPYVCKFHSDMKGSITVRP